MEQLAKAIKLAIKYREESFDHENRKYKMTLYDAADKASTEVGLDLRGTEPVHLLITHCWNEIQDWTELFKEE